MTGNTTDRMIVFPRHFILVASQAVRELLGIRDIEV